MKKAIATQKAPAAIGPYSQAVECGGLVFASGAIPVDPATGDERLAKLQEAEKVLVGDDAAIAPTFFQTRSWVSRDNVGGIVRQGIGLRCDFKWAYLP